MSENSPAYVTQEPDPAWVTETEAYQRGFRMGAASVAIEPKSSFEMALNASNQPKGVPAVVAKLYFHLDGHQSAADVLAELEEDFAHLQEMAAQAKVGES